MKCTKCGADGENGKFCSSCGNKLEENLESEEVQGYKFVEGEQKELSTTNVNKRKGFLGEKIKKFLKKIVLVFTILLLFCGIFASSGIGTKKDAIVEIITYYAYLGVLYIIPVGLIMNLGGIRDKLPLFKHHKLGKTVLGSLIVYMVMGFLCMGIAFGMDSLHTETYKIEYAKMLEERAKEAEKKAQEEAEKKAQEVQEKVQEQDDKDQKKEKEKIVVNKEQDVSNVEAEYLFADSDSVYYDEEQLIRSYDLETLWLGKNEIYARHGYIFKNQELKKYFEKQSWYKGTISSEKFNEKVFNDYEKANIALLNSILNYDETSADGYEDSGSGADEIKAMMPLPGRYVNSKSPFILTVDEEIYENAISQAISNSNIMVSIILHCQMEGDDYIEDYEGMINLLNPGEITVMTGVQSATYIEYDNESGELSNVSGIVNDYIEMHRYYNFNIYDYDYYEDNEANTYYLSD